MCLLRHMPSISTEWVILVTERLLLIPLEKFRSLNLVQILVLHDGTSYSKADIEPINIP